MMFMLIISLLIMLTAGTLIGIGISQSVGKGNRKTRHRVNQVTDEMMREALDDADNRGLWG